MKFMKDYRYAHQGKVLLLLLLFIAAFFSYQKNIFNAASGWWFEIHSLTPERFILDGILRMRETGDAAVPGVYMREHNDDPRGQYRAEDRSGPFQRYDSQYGLQVKFFAALANLGFGEIEQMHAAAALLMSAIVVFLVWLVVRDFSITSAAAVAALLILSPWIVIFARQLFWVSFTWFLPTAIAIYYSPRIFSASKAMVLRMLLLLYVTFLLKLLCGYEFATSVVIAVFCPIFYQAALKKVPIKSVLLLCIGIGTMAFLAFATALFLHISTISATMADGWDKFQFTAERRFYSGTPEATAKQTCKGDAECEKVTLESLKASPFDVVKIYFVMPEFLPWLSAERLTEAERMAFKASLNNAPSVLQKLKVIATQPPSHWFFVLAKLLNPLCFILFIIGAAYAAFRRGLPAQIVLLLAFLSPISWFIAAKSFCYIHDHLCFVIWYLPFLFYGTIFLCEEFLCQNKRKP